MKKHQKKIITLTTDFGNEDHYAASMRGVILSINPDVIIVDNTHTIDSFNVGKGAFNILNMYRYYPRGTINIAVVDPGVGSHRKSLLISADGYYFIGPDNGIFGYVIDNCRKVQVYSVSNREYYLPQVTNTFHGRDIFAPVASHLSLGVPINSFGRKTSNYMKLSLTKPLIKKNKLIGKFIYEDKFGNLITNISARYANKISKIIIDNIVIPSISDTYSNAKKGNVLALVGSCGYIEISVNMGSASEILNSKSEITCLLGQHK